MEKRPDADSTGRDPRLEAMTEELLAHLEVLARRFLLQKPGAQLSRNEATLLRFIASRGPSTMSDVSAHLGLALSSSTGVVDRLVERHLVDRARSERDRRSVVVTLTAKGERICERIVAERNALGFGMLEPLDPDQRERLLELFRAITAAESDARRGD